MTWQAICSAILLALGVVTELLCCLGLLLARDVYDRLHFMGPATLVGATAIAAAVVLQEANSQAGIKAALIAALLLFASPVLTHAIARAARIHAHGEWQARSEEQIVEI